MKGFSHPKGYYSMFSVLFLERLSYYGFGSLFIILLVKVLMMAPDAAYSLRMNFVSLLFVVPVIGGILADRYLGYKRSLYLAVISAALGNFIVVLHTIWLSQIILYIALVLLAVGYAFFRPALYMMIGSLYGDKNDPRRDSGFTLLYFATNLGAFFAPFMILALADKFGWWVGFLLSGIFSLASVLLIRRLEEPQVDRISPLTLSDRQKAYVLVISTVVVFIIWGVLSQTINLLGDVFANMAAGEGSESKLKWVQLINGGIFGVIMVPVFAWLWVKLASIKKEPTTMKKFFLALTLAAVTMFGLYAIFAEYRRTGKINIAWLAIFSLVFTSAELCIGPIAMSMVTKLAPSKIGATVLGLWFLLNFMFDKVAAQLIPGYQVGKELYIFLVPALLALGTAIIIVILYRKIMKWMNGVN
jgi:POT family proton-dependent oligopeptide transporter